MKSIFVVKCYLNFIKEEEKIVELYMCRLYSYEMRWLCFYII